MFNPGSNEADPSVTDAWKRHACRKVYYLFMKYFEQIRITRSSLPDTDVTPRTFDLEFISTSHLHKSITNCVLLNYYQGTYPAHNEEEVSYQCLPIVFCTNRKSPRHLKSLFVRELKLKLYRPEAPRTNDPVQVGNNAVTMQQVPAPLVNNAGMDAGHGPNVNVVAAQVPAQQPLQVQVATNQTTVTQQVHNAINVQQALHVQTYNALAGWIQFPPENYELIKDIIPKKANHNEHYLKAGNLVSPLAMIFIRGYLHIMWKQSVEGRSWKYSTGYGTDNFQLIGDIPIFQNYTIKNLVFEGDEWDLQCKNYCAKFMVNFCHHGTSFLTKENFFDTWINNLLNEKETKATSTGRKKRKPQESGFCTLLKKIKNELGDQHSIYAELFLHSYTAEEDNQRPAPNPTGFVFDFFTEENEGMNRLLGQCNTKKQWESCLQYAINNHCCSKTFVECIFKTRISWCNKIQQASNELLTSNGLINSSPFEKQNCYYNKDDPCYSLLP